jgi:trimethylamine--corrinoid protein Co-methyltransferase
MSLLSDIKRGRSGIGGGQYKVLSSEQLKAIDEAAKEILWRTGVILPNKDALEVLDKVGCVTDIKKEKVWIPPYIVDEAVNKSPKGFRTAGRDPKKSIKLDTNRVYFSFGIGPNVIDTNGDMRKPTLKDSQDCFRILDYCDNVDIAGSGVFGGPTTPEEDMKFSLGVRRARGYLRMLDLTEKPIDISGNYVFDREDATNIASGARDTINMDIVCRGSIEELRKLPLSFGMDEPVSPLMHETGQVDRLLVYARAGLPVWIGSETMANATGPATLAGTLALWTAETLSALVIAAMAASPEHRPPIMWITLLGQFDQKALTGPQMGAPEGALLQAACAQIAHYYGHPIRGLVETASKLPDAQAGYETAVALLISAMAGINFNTSMGVIGPGEIGTSFEKIVLDNDLVGYVKRIMEGIEVNDETLAVDVIDEVGPGGTFLAHPHTRKWFRKEQYFPTLFDRRKYEDWVRRGRKDAVQRAKEQVQEILRDHWPQPLDKDIRKRIEDYVKVIEKRESKKS